MKTQKTDTQMKKTGAPAHTERIKRKTDTQVMTNKRQLHKQRENRKTQSDKYIENTHQRKKKYRNTLR